MSLSINIIDTYSITAGVSKTKSKINVLLLLLLLNYPMINNQILHVNKIYYVLILLTVCICFKETTIREMQ